MLPSKTKIMKVEARDFLVMNRATQIQGRHLSVHTRDVAEILNPGLTSISTQTMLINNHPLIHNQLTNECQPCIL